MPWKLHRVRPLSRTSVRHNMELRQEDIEFVSDSERLCDDICVGDNIAFLCNNSGDEEFWLLLVDQAIHTLEATVVDGWGQEFLEGECVVRGLYYERLRSGSQTYSLLHDMPPAYVYSHLVVAMKF
jgi:hypothetical protein